MNSMLFHVNEIKNAFLTFSYFSQKPTGFWILMFSHSSCLPARRTCVYAGRSSFLMIFSLRNSEKKGGFLNSHNPL